VGSEDGVKGWTGKRLLVDLSIRRSWVEEIPIDDLKQYVGGRGLNAKFFMDRMASKGLSLSSENPVAFAVGPLAGTLAPCSGWTSISGVSPLLSSPYAHVSLPGHWGPQLKFAGFDQLILQGQAEHPLCLFIEGEKVHFEDGRPLWGKDTVETTMAIQEEKKDRDIEVLCIGPGGENLVSFANVIHRFSWTGDHIGLGCLFGSKNLKAMAIRGKGQVNLDDPDRFLQICLVNKERIQRNPDAKRLEEEGSFLLLRKDGGGLGIKNYKESSQADAAERWGASYFRDYFYGKEGCFSCPIHCGRISQIHGNYFGGLHLESAWSLGPRIGTEEWEKTLMLHRLCQLQGLDPTSFGSLLSWIMGCYEEGILLTRELEPILWGDENAAIHLIRWITGGHEVGKRLGQGSLRAAQSFGKGLEQVPHFWGMDLPVRDPRSSRAYALGRGLFPLEWDYLQSLTTAHPEDPTSSPLEVLALEFRKILADLNSLCPLVVARLPLLSPSDIAELFSAATGGDRDEQIFTEAVRRTIESEKALSEEFKSGDLETDPLPLRFFHDPMEKDLFEKEMMDCETMEKSVAF
jgi:aldehyde:ferredoxin oxidoreductase